MSNLAQVLAGAVSGIVMGGLTAMGVAYIHAKSVEAKVAKAAK